MIEEQPDRIPRTDVAVAFNNNGVSSSPTPRELPASSFHHHERHILSCERCEPSESQGDFRAEGEKGEKNDTEGIRQEEKRREEERKIK